MNITYICVYHHNYVSYYTGNNDINLELRAVKFFGSYARTLAFFPESMARVLPLKHWHYYIS